MGTPLRKKNSYKTCCPLTVYYLCIMAFWGDKAVVKAKPGFIMHSLKITPLKFKPFSKCVACAPMDTSL